MRRWLSCAALLAVPACANDRDDEDAQQPAAVAQEIAASDQDGFALVVDGDTVAVERFQRSNGQLTGELHDLKSGDRLTYTAQIGTDERITRIELAYYTGASAEPRQRATAEFNGDTLVATTVEGDERETERVVTPARTMLQIANSTAMLEQLARSFRAGEGEHADVPVLLIGRDEDEHEVIERVRVQRLAGDSLHITLNDDNQVRAAVDAEGRITGGVNPANNARIVRLR